MKKFLFIAMGLLAAQIALAQTDNKELAHQKGQAAVKLEDEGKYDEALALLADAIKLDPDDISYPYETAYSYYSQEKYDKAIEVLTKLQAHKDVFDQVYQLLGNAYDITNHSDKAVEVYNEGLAKFPGSGCLYLESGNVWLIKKDYNKAMSYYEKGIAAQPSFASNYYRAAKVYCASTEKMWGMIYGELFINLERNTKRTAEISKLLFDTYKSQITFKAKDTVMSSFSKQIVVNVNNKGKFSMPYSMIYEPTMLIAITGQKGIDLNSLNEIRNNFIRFYYERGFDKTYPNVLFAYNKQLIDGGYGDAYNHWLLSAGDTGAFDAWRNANKDQWDKFVKYFMANPLSLDKDHKFVSSQYN